jgi:thioredoxin-like negative regulator of GroEL
MPVFRSRLMHYRIGASLVLLAVLAQAARASDAIHWRADYDSARKEAAEKGKPIFLDFGTDDCVHCKRMHQTTFTDPGIVKLLNERFVPLKVDANREPRLTQMLRIQAYPTMILAGQDGKIIGWIEGYLEAKRMTEHLLRASITPTPDWMTREVQDAGRLIGAGEYARALVLLKKIVADGKDRPAQAKARELLREIETQAAARLEQAKQLDARGQTFEAIERLTDLQRQYAGAQATLEGGKLLTALTDRPDVRRARRAQDMLRLARDEAKMERYLGCLDLCEVLAAAYRDLPEGREGAELAAAIKANPQQMKQVCDALNERLTKMYMDLADSWLKKGERDEAAACLEKALIINPAGAAAANIQARLNLLNSRTPGVTTGLQKP